MAFIISGLQIQISYIYTINEANAIEYIFVSEESPREDKIHGTFAPATIAPSSAFANFVFVL